MTTISIVAWKGAKLTIGCLASIATHLGELPGCRVYVVDNASPDDSADKVQSAILENNWADWVTLIKSSANLGFAGGNNLAIRRMLQDGLRPNLILLLNPDTVVRAGALCGLLNFMLEFPEVGIAGGISEDPDGTRQHCFFRFPSVLGEFSAYLRLGLFDRLAAGFVTRQEFSETYKQVDWVSGAFMMVRREVFEQVGLMDENYFLYFEETDFTLRARKAGWSCWHVPQARIVHLVGQSSGVTVRDKRPVRLPAYWFESRRRYFILNHGRLYAIAADLGVILAHLFWQIRRIVQRRPSIDPPFFLKDFIRYSAIHNGRASLKPRQISL